MLLHRVPYPLDRGDRIRAYHMLKKLGEQFDVSVACLSDDPVTAEQRNVLSQLASRSVIRRISPRMSKLLGAAALATGKAITPAYFFRSNLAARIRDWHAVTPFDAVLTYCTGMINYAKDLLDDIMRREGPEALPRHMIDLVDVDSVKWSEFARQSRVPMRWVYAAESRRLRRVEAGHAVAFDTIAAVSDAEIAAYRHHVGDHPGLRTLRHAVDTDYFQPLPDHDAPLLVFVGTLDYSPNAQGVEWFAQHVMPLLRKHVTNARLQIVGRRPTEAVKQLDALPGVDVIGSVPDVRDYLAQASVVVAPLRLARGVQTKVLEAMAAGRAVVCSPGAAEGIIANDGEHLLIAKEPAQWVEQIMRLWRDGACRSQVVAAARRQIEQLYRWDACLSALPGMIMARQEEPSLFTYTPMRIAG